ncbi:Putative ribonuclease H protein At1g65750 [Linum perenne]
MSAPRGSSGEDVWLWGAEKDGLFSIRSAYNLVISHSVEELDTLWKLIWKWRGPNAQISWKPGSVNWVTVNVDGSVLRGPTRAAAGGAVRTEDGRAVGAFVANLGSCSVTRAELRGAVLGLELAWSMGYRFVELQLDSRAAIALIQQTGEPSHQHALEVLACQELCRRSWVVKIQHTYREGNKVADFLANRGHEFPFGVFLFPISDCNL